MNTTEIVLNFNPRWLWWLPKFSSNKVKIAAPSVFEYWQCVKLCENSEGSENKTF